MNSSTLEVSPCQAKKRFEFPDIYIILLFFIVLVGVLSGFIPAGQYERETLANGRESVVPGFYQQIEQTPVSPMDIIEAIPAGNVADGISNIFFPTSGYFIAALVAARVDYIRWIRLYTPFFIFTLGVASFGAVVANAID